MQHLLKQSQRCHSNGHALFRGHTCKREARSFVTTKRSQNNDEGESVSSTQLDGRRALLSRRRRSLSPLERISNRLPQEALGSDVKQLRDQNLEGLAQFSDVCQAGWEDLKRQQSEGPEYTNPSHPSQEDNEPQTLPRENMLQFGELFVAERTRKRQTHLIKMSQLKPTGCLQSNQGVIPHVDIVGRPAGSVLKTSQDVSILVRRPSLEDYVLCMKRGPNIIYPKVGTRCFHLSVVRCIWSADLTVLSPIPQDAALMLVMMDITEGDKVLESGSGSGSMSLFLSRAGVSIYSLVF